jgi:hypothetical protein
MIGDPSGRWFVSSLRWVDRGAIWRFDADSEVATSIRLSDATHVQVSAGVGELFTAVHHFNGARLLLSVQSYSDPGRPLSWIDVRDWAPAISGDVAAWRGLPQAYTGYLNEDAMGTAGYFVIRVGREGVSVDLLDWFGDAYDHGYQSVTSVVEMPDGDLLFGVQRSSDLVLCAADTLQVVRTVPLTAGYFGNPVPFLRRFAPEIWALDYETVVRVDYRDWQITGSVTLQPAGGGGGRPPGVLWMPPDERHVIVTRPFSADVTVLEAGTMTIVEHHEMGGQPVDAAALPDGRIIARDRTTGATLAR